MHAPGGHFCGHVSPHALAAASPAISIQVEATGLDSPCGRPFRAGCGIMRPNIMLTGIMRFLNREAELARLDGLLEGPEGRMAVLYGRRRVGKTRLLLEWTSRHRGLYTVADQSASEVQRRYLAAALSAVLPGFADVDYPDWAALFSRLGREAQSARWHGP